MNTKSVIFLTSIILALGLGWIIWSRRSSRPCPSWLAWLVELDNPIFRNNSAQKIISHLDLKAGMSVLDFGCGPGRLSIPLARMVGSAGEVTAFDIQEAMLQHVRAKAVDTQLSNIRTVQGAAGEGNLEPGRYDRAVLINVLGEVPDKLGLLKEIFGCLKADGLLCVTEVIADPDFQTRRQVLGLAHEAGFVENAFYGTLFAFSITFRKPLGEQVQNKATY